MINFKELTDKNRDVDIMGPGVAEYNPSFIVDRHSPNREILWSNDAANAICEGCKLVGQSFDQLVYIEKHISGLHPILFNDNWYKLKEETVIWEGQFCTKMTLEERNMIPDEAVLKTLENMIGILLHRLRSPLTGMQGYANLMESRMEDKTDTRQLGKIKKGINHLFKLLDDLETLQEIPRSRIEKNSYSANPTAVIEEVLSKYPSDIQKHITFVPSRTNESINCSPGDLNRILSLLIENAIEHAPAADNEILIDLPSPNTIKVSHKGEPIPPSITKELFFPFVTNKANKLGIGLTVAMLYAKRYKGSIFLTDNSLFSGVSFTFCLPPSSLQRTNSLSTIR